MSWYAELVNYARRVRGDWGGSPESAAAALDELADSRPRRPSGSVVARAVAIYDGATGKQLAHDPSVYIDDVGTLVLKRGYRLSSSPSPWRRVLTPVGLHADSAAAVTALASNEIHFLYLGRVATTEAGGFSWAAVVEVTTAYAGGGLQPWAEIAIYTGQPVPNSGQTLNPLVNADVASVFNSTGTKVVSLSTGSAVEAGTDVWFACGCRTTGTPYQLRALLPDPIQQGIALGATGSGTSRLATQYNATLLGTTVRPAWCSVYL